VLDLKRPIREATEIAQSDADAQFAACRRRDGRETLTLIWGGVT
jgi:hypothetical protein